MISIIDSLYQASNGSIKAISIIIMIIIDYSTFFISIHFLFQFIFTVI